MTTGSVTNEQAETRQSVRIALFQMNSGIDPRGNAAAICDALVQAQAGGAAMLFAPEMSLQLDQNAARAAANRADGAMDAALSSLADAARRTGVWLHMGSFPAPSGETGGGAAHARLRNRSLVLDAHGAVVATYDKWHLFDVDLPTGESWRESARFDAGETLSTIACPVGTLGLSICYDLRFPQLYEGLRQRGATALAVPAAFTVPTGEAHWHILLRARAIEQQCFVIAAAQAGTHEDGRTTFGHSLVVDPWGRVLLDMGSSGPGLAFCDLPLSQIDEVRQRIPVAQHRRPIPPVLPA